MKKNIEMRPVEVIVTFVVALVVGALWGLYVDHKEAEKLDSRIEQLEQEIADQKAAILSGCVTLVDTVVFRSDALTTWQQLQLAIAYTESRFDPTAVGKSNDSGVLQLTPIYISEVNRIAGTSYKICDAFDVEAAVAIFDAMQQHYNPDHDIEQAIRLHNKSPYYKREVLKNMEFIRNMEAVREAVKK